MLCFDGYQTLLRQVAGNKTKGYGFISYFSNFYTQINEQVGGRGYWKNNFPGKIHTGRLAGKQLR